MLRHSLVCSLSQSVSQSVCCAMAAWPELCCPLLLHVMYITSCAVHNLPGHPGMHSPYSWIFCQAALLWTCLRRELLLRSHAHQRSHLALVPHLCICLCCCMCTFSLEYGAKEWPVFVILQEICISTCATPLDPSSLSLADPPHQKKPWQLPASLLTKQLLRQLLLATASTHPLA